jgi:hypothetical protein
MRPQTQIRIRDYDFPTAVTFLLLGLAIGSVLTNLFSPMLHTRARNRFRSVEP